MKFIPLKKEEFVHNNKSDARGLLVRFIVPGNICDGVVRSVWREVDNGVTYVNLGVLDNIADCNFTGYMNIKLEDICLVGMNPDTQQQFQFSDEQIDKMDLEYLGFLQEQAPLPYPPFQTF